MKIFWRIITKFSIWLPVLIFVVWCFTFDQSPDLTPNSLLDKNIVLYPSPDSTVRPIAEIKKGQKYGRDRLHADWVRIFTADKKSGWLPETTLTAASRKPENRELTLREPSTLYVSSSFSADQIQELAPGTSVYETAAIGGWKQVSLKDKTPGWIYVLATPATLWHIPINHFSPSLKSLFHNTVFYRIDSWLYGRMNNARIQTRDMGFSRVLFLAGYGLLLMLPFFGAILIHIFLARVRPLSNFILRWIGIMIATILFFLLYYVIMLLPPADEHLTITALTGFIIMFTGYLALLNMYDSTNRCKNCHRLGTVSLVGYSETGKRHGEIITTVTGGGMKRETGREKFTDSTDFASYKCSACGAVAVVGSSHRTSGWH